jgi:hypothetical protein
MNQPVEDRLKKIEERLHKVEQQQTEPIRVTVERRQIDAERTLDDHTEMLREQSGLLQTIFTMVGTNNTDIAVLKHEMQGARADIISIKATQSDHGELLREHSQRFDKLEATQSEQGQKLDLILQLLQKKGE